MSEDMNQQELDRDEVTEQGELVYWHAWDSGNPSAGADVERVFQVGDQYIVIYSFEDETSGSYFSLPEAVQAAELNRVTDTTTEIGSTQLTDDEIASLLYCEEAPGSTITINGDNWRLAENKKFQKVI